jgi:hypothetical protein
LPNEEGVKLLVLDIAGIQRDIELRLDLRDRAPRHGKKVNKLPIPAPTKPFRDIGRNRNSSASDLICQSVVMGESSASCGLVYRPGQFPRSLPRIDFLEPPNRSHRLNPEP